MKKKKLLPSLQRQGNRYFMKEKIISKQLVFDDFFKVEKWYYQYEKENGELTEPVDRMVLKRQDAASAILYNTDRNVVLL